MLVNLLIRVPFLSHFLLWVIPRGSLILGLILFIGQKFFHRATFSKGRFYWMFFNTCGWLCIFSLGGLLLCRQVTVITHDRGHWKLDFTLEGPKSTLRHVLWLLSGCWPRNLKVVLFRVNLTICFYVIRRNVTAQFLFNNKFWVVNFFRFYWLLQLSLFFFLFFLLLFFVFFYVYSDFPWVVKFAPLILSRDNSFLERIFLVKH